jgi:hypothetical protein
MALWHMLHDDGDEEDLDEEELRAALQLQRRVVMDKEATEQQQVQQQRSVRNRSPPAVFVAGPGTGAQNQSTAAAAAATEQAAEVKDNALAADGLEVQPLQEPSPPPPPARKRTARKSAVAQAVACVHGLAAAAPQEQDCHPPTVGEDATAALGHEPSAFQLQLQQEQEQHLQLLVEQHQQEEQKLEQQEAAEVTATAAVAVTAAAAAAATAAATPQQARRSSRVLTTTDHSPAEPEQQLKRKGKQATPRVSDRIRVLWETTWYSAVVQKVSGSWVYLLYDDGAVENSNLHRQQWEMERAANDQCNDVSYLLRRGLLYGRVDTSRRGLLTAKGWASPLFCKDS